MSRFIHARFSGYLLSANEREKSSRVYGEINILRPSIRALKKLGGVNGAMSMTLDKLSSIHGDLVRTDPDWEKWDFVKLVEALNQWC